MYAAKSNAESPIWTGTFYTTNVTAQSEAAASVASTIVYELIKAGILVPAPAAR